MAARRVGLVGLGTISKYYLDAIERSPGWELAAVCDVRESALVPHRHIAPCFPDHRTMLREADLDLAEGADMVMVKPAMSYLDVLRDIAGVADVPVAAYQVSGEYAMIEAAVANGWLDRERTILESLTSIRRAGADVVLTYWAAEAAWWLRA